MLSSSEDNFGCSRFDILQEPIRWNFFPQPFFLAGAIRAVAHGGELDAVPHVVDLESIADFDEALAVIYQVQCLSETNLQDVFKVSVRSVATRDPQDLRRRTELV
jgi:hypothetical protein